MDLEKIIWSKSVKNNIGKIKNLVTNPKVAYTDVDGTLVGPHGCFFALNDGGYSLKPAETLIKALNKEIDIVLVSGRNIRQMLNDSRLLGLKNYISEMGSAIVYNNGEKTIYNFEATGDKPKEDIYESIQQAGVIEALFGAFPGMLEYHSPWSKERDFTAVLRGSIDIGKARTILESFPIKLEIIDNGKIDRKSPTLLCEESHAYHVIPAGVSKANGAKKDMELRGFDKANTIAVGDSKADIGLADFVGVFFLVRNGIESHPELSSDVLERDNIFVTEEHMGLGWAEALSIFL